MSDQELWDELPTRLADTTLKVLEAMAKLEKPSRGSPEDERLALEEKATKVQAGYDRLEGLARKTLGNGTKTGVSFFAWKGLVWRDRRYKHYDGVRGYWRQQDADYKAYKRAYDARTRALKKANLWEQAKAARKLWRAYEALADGHGSPDVTSHDDRHRLVHGLVEALDDGEKTGLYCERCSKAGCVHYPTTDLGYWLERARELGRVRRADRGISTAEFPELPGMEDIELDDFGGPGIDEPPDHEEDDKLWSAPERPDYWEPLPLEGDDRPYDEDDFEDEDDDWEAA
ncbi:MAG: hypothetical protein H6718_04225 [Polyangiaceae bacterium]|nr:hypothetical protein [Polyangiaceae bacterium]